MRFWLENNLRLLNETLINSWAVIKLRYWWATRDSSRLLVLITLSGILFAAGILIRTSLINQAINKQLHCLAQNIYHEARGEPLAGQYAVAEVTMNRVESGRYPDTVCKVVYQQRWDKLRKRYVGAFSWTEIQSDIDRDSSAWHKARSIAEEIYYKESEPRVHGAVFYHARYIRPSWARKRTEVARIGRHIFYK